MPPGQRNPRRNDDSEDRKLVRDAAHSLDRLADSMEKIERHLRPKPSKAAAHFGWSVKIEPKGKE